MKIEIEKSEYDRLKSREEKLMAYYEWFVDKDNDLATVEDIVNKNIELEEEIKKLKSDLSLVIKERDDNIKQNKKLREENELLKQCLDKLMFDADIVNVQIHLELWDYVYIRSDKQLKLNVKD